MARFPIFIGKMIILWLFPNILPMINLILEKWLKISNFHQKTAVPLKFQPLGLKNEPLGNVLFVLFAVNF
jgi:hypothetical protein